jgi:hypothetical protein
MQDHNQMRMLRYFILLLIPLSLFAAGHDISAIRYAPSDSVVDSPSVAFNGSHFLTLWPMASHLYGALADPLSVTAAPAYLILPFANPSAVQVTAAGSGYRAVWNQGAAPYLATLTSEGLLQHSVRLDATRLTAPRIASNGQITLVIDRTGNFTPPATIVASLYSLSGALVNRFTLPGSGGDSYDVTAAADGGFAVVTAGTSGVNEWRVANDGTIVSSLQIDPPLVNQPARWVGVASKGGRIAIAWMQLQPPTVSLAVVQANKSVRRVALPNGDVSLAPGLAILPIDTGFVVVWNTRPEPPESKAVFALRVDDDGNALGDRPVRLCEGMFLAAAASHDTIDLILLTNTVYPAALITRVDSSGFTPREPMPAALTPVRQLQPMLTANGAGFTAAWIEQSAGAGRVAAGHVSPNGEPLDGTGIALDQNPASSVAISHASSEALIVWIANAKLLAARLSPSGELLDPTPILITQQFPDRAVVAWNGTRYFVVWTDTGRVFGAFVGSDGVATNPKPLTTQTTPEAYVSALDVTWDGRQFIVVFGEAAPGALLSCVGCVKPTPDHVRVMRVSSAGDAIDTTPIRIPGQHVRAHVASSGSESIIALDGDVVTSTMIVRDGGGLLQLGAEVPLFRWINSVSSDVAWNGSAYTVGWQYWNPSSPEGPSWLAAMRVSRSGLPFEPLVTTVGPQDLGIDSRAWGPSVAANDAGDIALVVSEVTPPSYISRARCYLVTDLAPMPPPPTAPQNVISYFGGHAARIDWQSDEAMGFLIEWSLDFGVTWRFYGTAPGNIRSTSVFASVGNLFRVSAFGPGGISAGTITSIGSQQRRHSARQ